MKPIILTLSICLTICSVNLANSISNNGCQHRNFGQDTTVCVCSEKYCDTLDPIKKIAPDLVQIYSTSRDGQPLPDRFAYQILQFKNYTDSNDTVFDGIKFRLEIPDSKKMETVLGFGGAITDATGFNFKKLSRSLQNRLIRDYFSTEGIEYSVCRIPIGGSDMSLRPYSNDDYQNGDDFNLDHFKLQPEDLELKIPFLQMALNITKQLKIFGSTWSPPAWMKTNNKLTDGGHLKGDPDGPYYKAFARYLVKFFQEYQKQNIPFWGMTVVNEPTPWWYNSIEMTAQEQRDFVKKNLGPILKENNLDHLKVMIWDHSIVNITDYVEPILSDPEAANYTSGIAFHWYDNNATNRKNLKYLHEKYPEHFLLSTEACKIFSRQDKNIFNLWEIAENYTKDIMDDLNNYVIGWIDWNMLLDQNGGPTWAKNYLNASIVVNADGQEYYKQPAYYALGHFSKFIPPGSKIVHIDSSIMETFQSNLMDVVSYKRPDKGVGLILLNRNDEPGILNLVNPDLGEIHLTTKPHSITSLIWHPN